MANSFISYLQPPPYVIVRLSCSLKFPRFYSLSKFKSHLYQEAIPEFSNPDLSSVLCLKQKGLFFQSWVGLILILYGPVRKH